MENPKEDSNQAKMASADPQINRNDDVSETVKSEHLVAEYEQHVARNTARTSPEAVKESRFADQGVGAAGSSNLYVAPAPVEAAQFSIKDAMFTAKDVIGRWMKNVSAASRKAEVLAGNTWQHLKTSPSLADAAIGRIAQGTKVLAEGGYEKIFMRTFEREPDEKLVNSFACYLSTSAGPVMGIVYVSTEKLAFCSDSPIPYKTDGQTEYSYYKVVIPLYQIKVVTPSSSSTVNGLEKYIQVVSMDNHEFWFMGFLYYDEAVKCLQDSVAIPQLETV